jgi:hypothetical protein
MYDIVCTIKTNYVRNRCRAGEKTAISLIQNKNELLFNPSFFRRLNNNTPEYALDTGTS